MNLSIEIGMIFLFFDIKKQFNLYVLSKLISSPRYIFLVNSIFFSINLLILVEQY